MICKHCGAQIPDDAMFCVNCGKMVENEDTQTRVQSGYCTTCGAEVYEGDTVCSNCGQPLTAEDYGAPASVSYDTPPTETYGTKQKNSSNTPLLVVLVVLIVALIGGIAAFFIFRDNFIPKKNDEPNYMLTESGNKKAKATAEPKKTAEPAQTVKPAATANPASQPVAPVQSGINKNPGITEYMFASDTKLVTQNDLSSLTQAETRLLLNELYARHGYIFTTQEYKDYFSEKTWYVPTFTSQSDAEAQFNDTERQNKNIISEYEKSKGWR